MQSRTKLEIMVIWMEQIKGIMILRLIPILQEVMVLILREKLAKVK